MHRVNRALRVGGSAWWARGGPRIAAPPRPRPGPIPPRVPHRHPAMAAQAGHPRSRPGGPGGLRHGAAGRPLLPDAAALAARWAALTLPLSLLRPARPSLSPQILAAAWAPVGVARTGSQGAVSTRGIVPTAICRLRTGGLFTPRRGAAPSRAPQPRAPGPGTLAGARSSSPQRGTRRPGRSTPSRSGCPAGLHGLHPRLQCRGARGVATGLSRVGHLTAGTRRGVRTRSAGAGAELTGSDAASHGDPARGGWAAYSGPVVRHTVMHRWPTAAFARLLSALVGGHLAARATGLASPACSVHHTSAYCFGKSPPILLWPRLAQRPWSATGSTAASRAGPCFSPVGPLACGGWACVLGPPAPGGPTGAGLSPAPCPLAGAPGPVRAAGIPCPRYGSAACGGLPPVPQPGVAYVGVVSLRRTCCACPRFHQTGCDRRVSWDAVVRSALAWAGAGD